MVAAEPTGGSALGDNRLGCGGRQHPFPQFAALALMGRLWTNGGIMTRRVVMLAMLALLFLPVAGLAAEATKQVVLKVEGMT